MKRSAIIIGAGISGMYAAFQLSKNGYKVKLVESNHYIGGRCHSFKEKQTGEIIDNGQHLFMGAYKLFLSMINEIADEDSLMAYKSLELDIFSSTGKSYSLYSAGKSGKIGMFRALLKAYNISFSSKLQVLKLMAKIPFINSNTLNISAKNFLISNKQSDEIIRIFWEPLTLAVLNTSPSKASAKLLVNVLKKSFLANADSAKMIVSKVSFDELFTNFELFLNSNNSELIYNSTVKGIIIDEGTAIGIELNDGEKYYADIIISALPYYSLERILSDELYYSEFFKSLKFYKNSSIMSVYLWYEKKIDTADYFAMIDSNVQWVFNRRNYIKTNDDIKNKYPGHLSITISDAEIFGNMSKHEIIDLITEDLEIAIPEIKDNRLLNYQIIKEKRATFVQTPEIERFRLKQITPVNSLYIIGDWTNTNLPATIEGACQSAQIIVNYLINNK